MSNTTAKIMTSSSTCNGSVATRSSSKRKLAQVNSNVGISISETKCIAGVLEQLKSDSEASATGKNGRRKPGLKSASKSSTTLSGGRNFDAGLTLADLGPDVLEHVARYLDTTSAISLLRSSKVIYNKLIQCGSFWKQLCLNENFNEYAALKMHDPHCDLESEEDDLSDEEEYNPSSTSKCRKVEAPGSGKRSRRRQTYVVEKIRRPSTSKPEMRMSFHGEPLHDVKIPTDSPLWRKVFLRGIQMRRNICNGRFEMWRLFLTDQDHLPVKRMTTSTTFRELRSSHRSSPFNQQHRRVGIIRYWNESYLVAIQQSSQFTDVFVWSWNECQDSKFLYSHNFKDLYPNAFFPTAFFLWKKYLVLMPDVVRHFEERSVRSMIRVHDIEQNMKLVGSYDFPELSNRKRIVKGSADLHTCHDVAHLQKVQDKAVALAWAPKLSVFVFSLPDCQLLQEVALSTLATPDYNLDNDELDQRFILRDNTLMFMFHEKDFFGALLNPDEEENMQEKFGRVLFVDLDKFLTDIGNGKAAPSPIECYVHPKFDSNLDFIEKVTVINKSRFALILSSGKIIIRDIVHQTKSSSLSHEDKLVIPCPENLMSEYDPQVEDGFDTDSPLACLSRNGSMFLVMRHFERGRRIHAYDTNNGKVLFEIDLDSPVHDLCREPGYISIDTDGNFVCAADLDKIVIWNAKNGNYIRSITIPPHYNFREKKSSTFHDPFSWKGHADFAFAEDGIIVVHSNRDFPIAADIFLFW